MTPDDPLSRVQRAANSAMVELAVAGASVGLLAGMILGYVLWGG